MNISLRDFIFRSLLFDLEINVFRKSGINVGADITQSEAHLLADSLDLFSIERRNDALEMARLYAVLHAFENTVRSMIRSALEEVKGPRWWDTDAVPEKMRTNVKKREDNIRKNSWIEVRKGDSLEFTTLGDLANIIMKNWEIFETYIPSQVWIKQQMEELEQARNLIAHNRVLQPEEIKRMYMYILDWNKKIGL